jgi:hypothetical protein
MLCFCIKHWAALLNKIHKPFCLFQTWALVKCMPNTTLQFRVTSWEIKTVTIRNEILNKTKRIIIHGTLVCIHLKNSINPILLLNTLHINFANCLVLLQHMFFYFKATKKWYTFQIKLHRKTFGSKMDEVGNFQNYTWWEMVTVYTGYVLLLRQWNAYCKWTCSMNGADKQRTKMLGGGKLSEDQAEDGN